MKRNITILEGIKFFNFSEEDSKVQKKYPHIEPPNFGSSCPKIFYNLITNFLN